MDPCRPSIVGGRKTLLVDENAIWTTTNKINVSSGKSHIVPC